MGQLSSIASQEVHLSSHSTGQGSRVSSKWTYLKVIEEIREPLGLKGTTIAVLRAALSYIRSDTIEADRHDRHVCFASNASLAKRAHVSIQTVERHVSKLVSCGLLRRVSSGNGKRWARRDHHGRIVFATGLSVLPLMERSDEFAAMANTQRDALLKLTLLRDQCITTLAKLVESCGKTINLDHLKARARNVLRRKPNSEALEGLLSEIIAEMTKNTDQNTEKMRGNDSQIEGHKETSLTQSVSTPKKCQIDVSQRDMEQAFPKLCLELRHASSQQACAHHMDALAQHLDLGLLWNDIKDQGPALSFMILGYLLERLDQISHPKGYAWRLLSDLKEDRVSWQSLLKRRQSASKTPYSSSRSQDYCQATCAAV